MTSPAPERTPVYQLRKFANGEPMANLGVLVNDHADKVEAALIARGVPPTDLQALIAAGWFTSTAWTPLTVASAFASGVVRTIEIVRVARRVELAGAFGPTGLAAANTSYTVVAAGGIPSYMRPSKTKIVPAAVSPLSAAARIAIQPDGSITLTTGPTVPSSYTSIDGISWAIT